MTDRIQKEFSLEILAIKQALGFADRPAEYAGMLMAAAVVMAQEAGMSKGEVITVAARTYENSINSWKAANDDKKN